MDMISFGVHSVDKNDLINLIWILMIKLTHSYKIEHQFLGGGISETRGQIS